MKSVILLWIVLCSISVSAESLSSFWIKSNHKNLDQISNQFEIVQRIDKKFLVYVLKEKISNFKSLAPDAELVEKIVNKNLKSTRGYHSFEEVIEIANNLEKKYSKIAKIEHYGKSKNGLPLFALRISSGKSIDKKLMLTSATHGDELITVEVQLELAKILLESYGVDERLTKVIDRSEIYMIFVVNPEGFTRRSRYAGGIDPNRQYPWPGNPNRRTPVVSIDALMDFYKKKNFAGSIDFHAHGKMVMFPWGYTRDLINSSDHDHFSELTKEMARENRYKHGPISRVIYVAKGSSADFYYNHNNGVALAVELGRSKAPRSRNIPAVVEQAKEMTWTFLERMTL
jgi:predicted deacylase